MKVVAETLGVARSDLVDRLKGKTKPRRRYHKAQDGELVPRIATLVGWPEGMKPSPFFDRMVDVMEELMKLPILTRANKAYLLDRYSERKESAAELSKRVNQKEN